MPSPSGMCTITHITSHLSGTAQKDTLPLNFNVRHMENLIEPNIGNLNNIMKFIKLFVGALLYFNTTLLLALEMPNTVQFESLSQKIASKIVVAAVEDCTKRGYKVSASVVGRDGNLLAFLRNPLSGPHTIQVSQRKAFTSASLQAPTSAIKSRQDLNYAPGILLIVGGVPISVGGKFYGGVAVAGAEPEVDEKCALTGIEAIKDILEFGE